MTLISTKVHAIGDYILGVVLLLSPWMFRLMDVDYKTNAAVWVVPALAGVIQMNVATLTMYEGGVYKKIPMKVHLRYEMLMGSCIALTPWLFGFHSILYWPHLLMGGALFAFSALTEKEARTKMTESKKPWAIRKG